jgi:VWFA-related protein
MLRGAIAGGTVSVVCLPLFFLFARERAIGQSGSTISVAVNLVVLHATVRDKRGRFVSGLSAEDFRVLDDGAAQTIKVFQHEDVPVAVGLVVDNSWSMRRKKQAVTEAALAFVRSSNERDQMFVVNFNERVSFGLPRTEPFSDSVVELEQALNGVPANGKTALYDGIEAGLAQLTKATRDKKVLIVISDGGDNASRHTLGQVLEDAERSTAIIYTIGLFDPYDEDSNPGVLRKIARATGGETFLPEETREVVKICERIAKDIRNQYTIGYTPTDEKMDRAYRTINVTAKGPHGEKLLVRTRTGYITSPDRVGESAHLR